MWFSRGFSFSLSTFCNILKINLILLQFSSLFIKFSELFRAFPLSADMKLSKMSGEIYFDCKRGVLITLCRVIHIKMSLSGAVDSPLGASLPCHEIVVRKSTHERLLCATFHLKSLALIFHRLDASRTCPPTFTRGLIPSGVGLQILMVPSSECN